LDVYPDLIANKIKQVLEKVERFDPRSEDKDSLVSNLLLSVLPTKKHLRQLFLLFGQLSNLANHRVELVEPFSSNLHYRGPAFLRPIPKQNGANERLWVNLPNNAHHVFH
tara:strand:- start:371 stop:700 length:330 start_codon:yes stop_codon:yes gene_type:complete